MSFSYTEILDALLQIKTTELCSSLVTDSRNGKLNWRVQNYPVKEF